MKPIFAALLLLAGSAAPAAAQLSPIDDGAVVAPCGGDLTAEQLAKLPRAEADARLACFTREIAKQINAQLPAKLDPISTLERVSAEGARLTYHYRLDLLRAELPAGRFDALKTGVRTKICQDPDSSSSIGFGGSYQFYWKDRNGEPIDDLLVTSCEKARPAATPPVT